MPQYCSRTLPLVDAPSAATVLPSDLASCEEREQRLAGVGDPLRERLVRRQRVQPQRLARARGSPSTAGARSPGESDFWHRHREAAAVDVVELDVDDPEADPLGHPLDLLPARSTRGARGRPCRRSSLRASSACSSARTPRCRRRRGRSWTSLHELHRLLEVVEHGERRDDLGLRARATLSRRPGRGEEVGDQRDVRRGSSCRNFPARRDRCRPAAARAPPGRRASVVAVVAADVEHEVAGLRATPAPRMRWTLACR